MPLINNGNALESIEEASVSSSSNDTDDGVDFLNTIRKYDTGSEIGLNTRTNTDCVNLQNSSINIDNSNDVVIGSITHFHGPVAIYQNQNDVSVESRAIDGDGENHEGKLVKPESVSSEKSCTGDEQTTPSKLQTVLAIVAFITITAVVALIIVYFTAIISEGDDVISTPAPDTDLGTHRMIYRDEWGGRPPLYTIPLKTPVKYVIISHTEGMFCDTTLKCAPSVRDIQTWHFVNNNFPDIGHNFLICGDGNIYVGRDWYTKNMHSVASSIGVGFIGNYVYDHLTDTMIEAAHLLLELGVKKGVISEDYKLIAHNQTVVIISPGENIYKVIKEWPHFYPSQVSDT